MWGQFIPSICPTSWTGRPYHLPSRVPLRSRSTCETIILQHRLRKRTRKEESSLTYDLRSTLRAIFNGNSRGFCSGGVFVSRPRSFLIETHSLTKGSLLPYAGGDRIVRRTFDTRIRAVWSVRLGLPLRTIPFLLHTQSQKGQLLPLINPQQKSLCSLPSLQDSHHHQDSKEVEA